MDNKSIACYIRVSTDKIDQQRSLQNQRELLEKTYGSENIEMYSDTGSGTSYKRKGFQQMMFDAGLNLKVLSDGRLTFEVDKERKPLFNEIVVISTSRFARNIIIIDVLRALWDYKKVNVFFQDLNKNSNNSGDMVLLQMMFTMAENEVAETSKRTKRGNKVSIEQNRIRNNSIYGWDFDRENNALIKNEAEAKGVEFIFNAVLTNGFRVTSKKVNEAGYRTKKGNLWSDSTIKSLVMNPKYKGYNVRNKFENVNLFTESKTKYIHKDKWVVKKNDRIDPLVSEELWDNVQKAIKKRLDTGNKGANTSKYDTSGKVKCGKCGATYSRNVEVKVADKPMNQHFLICTTKKKHGVCACGNHNISVGLLDEFIEKERKNYYSTINLQLQLALELSREELSEINKAIKEGVNGSIKDKEIQLKEKQDQLESLMNNFGANNSNTMLKLLAKKEAEIKLLEDEIKNFTIGSSEMKRESRRISANIKMIKKQMETLPNNELTRQQWLDIIDRIVVHEHKQLEPIYKIDEIKY